MQGGYMLSTNSWILQSVFNVLLFTFAMKVVERIFEHRIRQQIVIDDMQFGFMKGKSAKRSDKLGNA